MKKNIFAFILAVTFFSVHAYSEDTNKLLIIESEPHYPPFCFQDEDGNAAGFSIELFKRAAGLMGYDTEFSVKPWHIIKDNLAAGRIDALPMVGRSPERESYFDFTVPYYTLHGAVFVRNNSQEISSIENLETADILVMRSDNADEYVSRTFPSANIIRTETFEDAFKLLCTGTADAVVAQKLMGQELLAQLGLTGIKVMDIKLEGFAQDFCFAVKKGNAELLSDLNEALVLMNSDGTYDEIYKTWFYSTISEMTYSDIVKALFPILVPVVLIILIIAIIVLQYLVRSRTRSLKKEISEKQVLLKEVHHRIKNNFASTEAFIHLTGMNHTNEEVKSVLKEINQKISSMRLLYDKMLLNEAYQQFPLDKYVTALVDDIGQLFSGNKDIKFDTQIEKIEIKVEELFYIGIIINELITNSIKYAFPDTDEGRVDIVISVHDKNSMDLIVRDNGIGFDPGKEGRRDGFGLSVVNMLSEQMGGFYHIKNNNGVENIVRIKIKRL